MELIGHKNLSGDGDQLQLDIGGPIVVLLLSGFADDDGIGRSKEILMTWCPGKLFLS